MYVTLVSIHQPANAAICGWPLQVKKGDSQKAKTCCVIYFRGTPQAAPIHQVEGDGSRSSVLKVNPLLFEAES